MPNYISKSIKAFFILAIIGVSYFVLFPLLKPSYKAELVVKTPYINTYQKQTIIRKLKSHKDSTKVIDQITAYFIGTGSPLYKNMNINTKFSSPPPWEHDTLKIHIASSTNDSSLLKSRLLKIIKHSYKSLKVNNQVLKENITGNISYINKKIKKYETAISIIKLEKPTHKFFDSEFSFLLSQNKKNRLLLLKWDIEILKAMKEKNNKLASGNESVLKDFVRSNDISSSKFHLININKHGPHTKEFTVYLLILIMGCFLLFVDLKRKDTT